jgi:signal transduction histidine kinase
MSADDETALEHEDPERTVWLELERLADSSGLPDARMVHELAELVRALAFDNAKLRKSAEEARSARDEAVRAVDAALSIDTEQRDTLNHELRTRLHSILGFAELLRRDRIAPLQPRHAERVAGILEGAECLLHMLDEITDATAKRSKLVQAA